MNIKEQIIEEIKQIANYLGANEAEMVSEMSKLLSRYDLAIRQEMVEKLKDSKIGQNVVVNLTMRNRLDEARDMNGFNHGISSAIKLIQEV